MKEQRTAEEDMCNKLSHEFYKSYVLIETKRIPLSDTPDNVI